MKQNNNFSVLPFYDDIEEQNHRRSYAYGEVYGLITPSHFLLPFQIVKEHNGALVASVELYEFGGAMVADLTQTMAESGLRVHQFEEYDVFVYPAVLPLSVDIMDGRHYIKLTDTTGRVWYSEVFTVVQDVSAFLCIEWWDSENFVFDSGIIVYENTIFKNKVYLCTELGKPNYKYEETGEERNGYFFATKQLSEKVYRATATAPEYLCDVLRFVRMADYIRVTDKYGRKYKVDNFLLTPTWLDQGDLAQIDIEFETNTIIKKVGRGFIAHDKGDFNNDFNNDFNT